ncbi:MAG: PadR family transcriptional regulator [Thermoanaerobaculia bacterium]|nr:PadR family transcriptional regulator [Thermoanaerobaculia bacterium]
MNRKSLGDLELLVLLAALRLGEDEAYAVSIAAEIRDRTGRSVQRATIYVTLQRLEHKGLVTTHLSDPIEKRGGKPRRMVRVESRGRAAVLDTQQAFEKMWSGLELAGQEPRS